ncbi:hypothetical protein EJ06DRAFT_479462 [Trichodelitschia bisporula]|uniref:DUF3955 domain-containing protein n=1 Tax=Trichodelitschia bisporula TaxID=703511 RepID=A0A6G1HRI4_9PEZI|nr:hypothetical protein EJ06DRAFT_479462 [Trichodelitschia bisporula]
MSTKRSWDSRWRHTLGICALAMVVCLWTLSNFLASTIFADNTYSKPYFVTYVNSCFFILPLGPMLLRQYWLRPSDFESPMQSLRNLFRCDSCGRESEREAFIKPDDEQLREGILDHGESSASDDDFDALDPLAGSGLSMRSGLRTGDSKLSPSGTLLLSLHFSILWFAANYMSSACLEYTTVASTTILTSTSSIWTLVVGTLLHVEKFTVRKLLGVLASVLGIILVSSVDITGKNDGNRGTFPHKSPKEIATGDVQALFSAILYGLYIVIMKKKIGDERRVNMPLFFGFVGLLNMLLLWPGFFILNWTGIEPFELPPKGRVLTIILASPRLSSLLSDFCWAYAALLTSPLVTTVGLSMSIPLSLIGQMIIHGQYVTALYWLGAAIVLTSFIIVNHEESKEEAVSGPPVGILSAEEGWNNAEGWDE